MSRDSGGCSHTLFAFCAWMLEGIPSVIASKIFSKFIFLSGKGNGKPTFTPLWISLQPQVSVPYLRGMQIVTGGPFPVVPSPCAPAKLHSHSSPRCIIGSCFSKESQVFWSANTVFGESWCSAPCALSAIPQAGLGPNHGTRCCGNGQQDTSLPWLLADQVGKKYRRTDKSEVGWFSQRVFQMKMTFLHQPLDNNLTPDLQVIKYCLVKVTWLFLSSLET